VRRLREIRGSSELELVEAIGSRSQLPHDQRRPASAKMSAHERPGRTDAIRHALSQGLARRCEVHFDGLSRVHAGQLSNGRGPWSTKVKTRFVLALLIVVAAVAAYGGTCSRRPESHHEPRSWHLAVDEIDAKTLSSKCRLASTPRANRIYGCWRTRRARGSFGWHSHPGPSIVLVKTAH